MTGDRGTYPVQTTVTKKGRTLTFDNAGTHAQAGAINVGFAAWRGAILGSINVLHAGRPDGLRRRRRARLPLRARAGHDHLPGLGRGREPGRRLRDRDGDLHGNSRGHEDDAGLERRDDARNRALSPDGAQWRCHFVAGINQRGDYYVGGMGDNMLGASGACWNRDGEFANGHYWIPEGRGPNVELYERDWPILYLYRREHADSGGAGRFRAGNGGEIAYILHGGDSALGLYTTEGIPKTNGIFGGDPAIILRTRVIRDSEILRALRGRRVPAGHRHDRRRGPRCSSARAPA